MKNKIGLIGCGNMGEAIIKQAQSEKRKAKSFIFSEKNKEKKIYIQNKYKIHGVDSNRDLVRLSDIIIIAVKPQDFNKVLDEICKLKLNLNNKLFISIAAGITTKFIEEKIGGRPSVIRIMPNLPCVIKKGISSICLGRHANVKDFIVAKNIFSNLGKVTKVREESMNAITAISGSGPAYFYYLIEALEDAAIKFGLSKELARQLIIETGIGALELLKARDIEPRDLRKQITSKSGTTEAAISVFNINELQEVIKDGLLLATERAKLLSELMENR